MRTGIILAGGRATRLGPLAAQLNKSLVSVGNKPMLVRQIQQLRAAGCEQVNVVASPGSKEQVIGVCNRAGFDFVEVRVQERPAGPADAVRVGAATVRGEVLLMMADSLVRGGLNTRELTSNDVLVGVHEMPWPPRSWCWWDDGKWVDGEPPWADPMFNSGPKVAVGVYAFGDGEWLQYCARRVKPDERTGEQGMAPLLNAYAEPDNVSQQLITLQDWQDVGDVGSLAKVVRGTNLTRDFNDVTVSEDGVLTKRGPDAFDEGMTIMGLRQFAPHLFPDVFDVKEGQYSMDFVDLPTLSELFLYWPGNGDMWSDITRRLYLGLGTKLWETAPHEHPSWERRLEVMWADKLSDRYYGASLRGTPSSHLIGKIPLLIHGTIRVNDTPINTSQHRMFEVGTKILREFPHELGRLHGDPNFSNVLWSLRSGTFKLLDPRVGWGGQGNLGDTLYDVAKIAYSPDFAAITHGLFELKTPTSQDVYVRLTPVSTAAHAVWETLKEEHELTDEQLWLLRGFLLVSGAPLHSGDEAIAMYAHGWALIEEGMKG